MPFRAPLRFRPIPKTLVWGGRRLHTALGRELPGGADQPVGESWELVDLPGEQSTVVAGPLAGLTLAELLAAHRAEVLGQAPLAGGRFPLLCKLIDAARPLSVQVHPDAPACARLGGGARPKTEAWYVLAAEPGAVLHVGLASAALTREALAAHLERGDDLEPLLHRVAVRPGDLVYLAAGTVHAIGAGVLLAEVQQTSDTTYRLHDWGRVGLDGMPRPLHVREALESIRFGQAGPPPAPAPPSGRRGLACSAFTVELVEDQPRLELGRSASARIVMWVGGTGRVAGAGQPAAVRTGDTLLLPAAMDGARIDADPGGRYLLIAPGPAP